MDRIDKERKWNKVEDSIFKLLDDWETIANIYNTELEVYETEFVEHHTDALSKKCVETIVRLLDEALKDEEMIEFFIDEEFLNTECLKDVLDAYESFCGHDSSQSKACVIYEQAQLREMC